MTKDPFTAIIAHDIAINTKGRDLIKATYGYTEWLRVVVFLINQGYSQSQVRYIMNSHHPVIAYESWGDPSAKEFAEYFNTQRTFLKAGKQTGKDLIDKMLSKGNIE